MTWSIIPIIIYADYVTKDWINTYYYLWQVEPLLGDVIRITNVRNTGAAFGIAQGFPDIFKYITMTAIIGISLYKIFTLNRSLLFHFALSLILSGACGNLIDRLRFEYVVDFIDIGIGTLRWPSFNIADISISLGVIILIILSFIEDKKRNRS